MQQKMKSSPGINQPTTPLHPKKTWCWVSQTVEDPPSWLPHYKNRKDPLASARVEWSKLQVDVTSETVKHGFKQNMCWKTTVCFSEYAEGDSAWIILWMWNSRISVARIKLGVLEYQRHGPFTRIVSLSTKEIYVGHPSSVTSHITLFLLLLFYSDSGYLGWMQSGSNFFTSSCPNLEKKKIRQLGSSFGYHETC